MAARDPDLPDIHALTQGACRVAGLCSLWCRYRLTEGPDACALAVAAAGAEGRDDVAERLGVSRERVRQIEVRALRSFQRRAVEHGLEGVLAEGLVEARAATEPASPEGGCGTRGLLLALRRFEARHGITPPDWRLPPRS